MAVSSGTAILGAPGHPLSPGAAYLFGLLLCGDVTQISLATGGTQTLDLTAGGQYDGDIYVLLGSITGTTGFSIGEFVVPLDIDPYFVFTLSHPSTAPLSQSLGILNAAGEATALFVLTPGFSPSLAGVTVHHAYGVVDSVSGAVEEVSNPVGLQLVP